MMVKKRLLKNILKMFNNMGRIFLLRLNRYIRLPCITHTITPSTKNNMAQLTEKIPMTPQKTTPVVSHFQCHLGSRLYNSTPYLSLNVCCLGVVGHGASIHMVAWRSIRAGTRCYEVLFEGHNKRPVNPLLKVYRPLIVFWGCEKRRWRLFFHRVFLQHAL